MVLLPFLVAFGLSGIIVGEEAYKGKEAWGYVNVRQDAYMFWWLYYTDVAENYSDYPLVIWLQGGPGASSTGYGNFLEIGPLDVNLKPRNTTWVKKANLLFLDNPVGTGFSYVTNSSALATNNTQIADDLVATVASLMQNIPEFQKSPLYLFGESYGGKMVVDFAIALQKAIKAGKVVCNFKGLALGDSWISPVDSVATWGQYLYTMSLISKVELKELDTQVVAVKKAMQSHQYSNATNLFQSIQSMIDNFTNGVDFYNILKNEGVPKNQTVNKFPCGHKLRQLYSRLVGKFHGDDLATLMNGPIKDKLHVIPKNITWGGQSSDVFAALINDFMKPVIASVETLLNETTLSVNVYTGQLDLIVDTLGTLQWIEQLKWPGLKNFMSSQRIPLKLAQNHTGGFVASFKNFQFFWILKAGHMIPSDAGVAALQMLDKILYGK